MEIALNLTLDDGTSPSDQAAALQLATTFACANLRARGASLSVDEQIDLDIAEGPLQNATINRFA